MKWPVTTKKVGQRRVRTAWLVLPKCIGYQWRWLERAHWLEQFQDEPSCFGGKGWFAVAWCDAEGNNADPELEPPHA